MAIRQLIEMAWESVLERRPAVDGHWLTHPRYAMLDAERVESRFIDDLPVLGHIEQALELAAEHELAHLARGFESVLNQVKWSQNPSYDFSNVEPAFLDGYAYAGLAGPDCPVRCEVPRFGFLLLAPRVTYTDHRHGPREFYLMLTPGSQWRLDNGDWFDVAPGDLILHEPWQTHAMRSGGQPFLAFAGWLEHGEREAVYR